MKLYLSQIWCGMNGCWCLALPQFAPRKKCIGDSLLQDTCMCTPCMLHQHHRGCDIQTLFWTTCLSHGHLHAHSCPRTNQHSYYILQKRSGPRRHQRRRVTRGAIIHIIHMSLAFTVMVVGWDREDQISTERQIVFCGTSKGDRKFHEATLVDNCTYRIYLDWWYCSYPLYKQPPLQRVLLFGKVHLWSLLGRSLAKNLSNSNCCHLDRGCLCMPIDPLSTSCRNPLLSL